MTKRDILYKIHVNFIAWFVLVIIELFQNILTVFHIYERKQARLPNNLTDKVLVITGANCGIGKLTAKTFAKLGAKVYMLCRDEEKALTAMGDICKDLKDLGLRSNLKFEKLDLSSFKSIRKCAARINSRVTQIDYLINNAAVMACPESQSEDGYELQFATNHLGHFLLTDLLLDKINESESARIINLTSVTHINGQIDFENINLEGLYNPLKAYSQSKLANVLFTQELARRLRKNDNIKVFAVHPGVIYTKLSRHINSSLRSILKTFCKLIFISPEMGIQTTLYCALDERCQNDESGGYYSNCQRLNQLYPHATDEVAARKLWEISVKMCNMQYDRNENYEVYLEKFKHLFYNFFVNFERVKCF